MISEEIIEQNYSDKSKTISIIRGEKMKKVIVTILVALHLIPCFATELWNGFTDEMTKQQVISRANKLLNTTPSEFDSIAGNNGIELFFDDLDHSNHFLSVASVVCYSSPNKEFQRHSIYGASGGNVRFYFIENILYAVEVEWNPVIADQVITKAKETYGHNFTLFPLGSIGVIPLWDFPDKEVYLDERCITVGVDPFPQLHVFSKEKMKRGREIMKQQAEAKRQKAEQERQQAANSIAF